MLRSSMQKNKAEMEDRAHTRWVEDCCLNKIDREGLTDLSRGLMDITG